MGIIASAAAVVIVGLGWLTGLQQVAHGTLLVLAVAAFLPFIIIAAGLLIALVGGLIIAFSGGDSDNVPATGELVEGGIRLVPHYYRFFTMQRQPVFWGVPAGMALGCLLLFGMLAVLVLPGEMRTSRILVQTKHAVESVYRTTGRFPAPDDRGYLPRAAVKLGNEGVVIDGFGRPLGYRVSGRWKLAAFRLSSLGYDGQESGDDACVSGSSQLWQWLDKRLERLLDKDIALSVADRLAGVSALRCR